MNRPELPDPLRDLILTMAARPDVHSVSCQFWDARLWEGLLREQVERARQTGKPPRHAFFLCGPDSGIPGIAKHHALLIEQDLGETPCATRSGPIAGRWWLYSSTAPYQDCNPFRCDR